MKCPSHVDRYFLSAPLHAGAMTCQRTATDNRRRLPNDKDENQIDLIRD